MPRFLRLVLVGSCLVLVGVAQALTPPFPIGNGPWRESWVDPVHGDDARSGATRGEALRTVTEAWRRIPLQQTLIAEGVRIKLTAGTHTVPNYWESRWGSFAAPIVIEAADGVGTARLPASTFFDVRHLYLIGLHFSGGDGGDGLQCERCNFLLLRGVTIDGNATRPRGVQEGLKVNQSQFVFVEDSDISGAGDNALDFVAVQYGHILNSRIHDAVDWCGYVKGGAFDLTVEGNIFHDCGNGGFTVGQGTGFQFMSPPFLHYEGSHVRVLNNLVHDTVGAAFGVNGGYNITIAYNTAWRVGRQSHVLEVVHGSRSCDGAPASATAVAACREHQQMGGWGTTDEGGQWIPSRNVFILNNVIYNPPDAASRWQHFTIATPVTPPAESNLSAPARVDEGLVIRGNVIWNGPANHPLGIEDLAVCTSANPDCNVAQLVRDNAINTLEPALVNLAGEDARPVPGGAWLGAPAFGLPAFSNTDRPTRPAVPAGPSYVPSDTDRRGALRSVAGPAGAVLLASAALIVAEYFAPALNHYFVTASAAEQQGLEANPGLGWQATGVRFAVGGDGAAAGMATAWRFYGDPVIGPNSHFYTAVPEERDLLLRQSWATPAGSPRWNYEAAAFAPRPAVDGACPAGRPVTRLYNLGHVRGDPNHRFVLEESVAQAMVTQGWAREGVVFCTAE